MKPHLQGYAAMPAYAGKSKARLRGQKTLRPRRRTAGFRERLKPHLQGYAAMPAYAGKRLFVRAGGRPALAL